MPTLYKQNIEIPSDAAHPNEDITRSSDIIGGQALYKVLPQLEWNQNQVELSMVLFSHTLYFLNLKWQSDFPIE